ncbi:MAG: phosphoglycolate phosphatase [Betaproteobacteria bacterium]|nr:MAG: phosphoglycolate phosphatase [Betaproteobacteria bacterium]
MPRCILFDLDGTLVDTAPDLAIALNQLLHAHGKPALTTAAIRPVASHGTPGLLGLGFGLTPLDAAFAELRREYLDLYEATAYRASHLFDGLAESLAYLENDGRRWGVVTNKPARFTEPLLAALNLSQRAACIVSGDSAAHPKPDPAPMRMACQLAAVAATECLYIGDAERDCQAAHAVDMPCAIAGWGYLGPDDHPADWGAEHHFATPYALLRWLQA